jgi:predicted dehydrogenase
MASNNPPTFRYQVSRRRFLYSSALGAAGAVLLPGCITTPNARFKSPNEKLNIGVIGAGGKGSSDTDSCASENIVALCDVDSGTLDARGQKYPGARKFTDFRIMLEQMKNLDAVIVATPDHMHAPAAAMAMKMGLHAYVQKPLTHDVFEARTLRQLARKYGVATQMGNQGSAQDGLRRAVEVVQAGAIGGVREVHVWSNRPIWPQGIARPTQVDPVPSTLDWDGWIGTAPMRPFNKDAYHPFKWRGWIDFGTGALGDMACHTANMPFRALKLGFPTSIEASSTGMNGETWPTSSRIRFEFPAREGMPPVSFFWYDGGAKPSTDTTSEIMKLLNKDGGKKELPASGCLLVGDKGQLFSPDDYGAKFHLLPEKNFMGYEGPAITIPRSPGHYVEWINACKGGPAPYSNFEIAAYLTEIILLGCVALRAGKKIEWDGPNLRAKNAPEVTAFVQRKYRAGYSL